METLVWFLPNNDCLLPDQFDSQLYLAGRSGRRHDLASAIDGGTLGVEQRAVFERRGQVGMIEDVEDLGAKLQVEFAPDASVLKEGDVERLQTGTNDGVAAKVTQHVDSVRKGEALEPKVARRIV